MEDNGYIFPGGHVLSSPFMLAKERLTWKSSGQERAKGAVTKAKNNFNMYKTPATLLLDAHCLPGPGQPKDSGCYRVRRGVAVAGIRATILVSAQRRDIVPAAPSLARGPSGEAGLGEGAGHTLG